MSFHIHAQSHEIAETVLLPGDPLRAKWIAETYLKNPICYNEVRGMYGFTGDYNGKRISVQGTGMGGPSILIYCHELINDYGAKQLIRVGSAGSLQPSIALREIVIAMAASHISAIGKDIFGAASYAPTADADLFIKAVRIAEQKNISVRKGSVLSGDFFYTDAPDYHKKWTDYGVLCVEMETAALYTIAAQFGVKALSLLTISDSMLTGAQITQKDRETSMRQMIEIALGLV